MGEGRGDGYYYKEGERGKEKGGGREGEKERERK